MPWCTFYDGLSYLITLRRTYRANEVVLGGGTSTFLIYNREERPDRTSKKYHYAQKTNLRWMPDRNRGFDKLGGGAQTVHSAWFLYPPKGAVCRLRDVLEFIWDGGS